MGYCPPEQLDDLGDVLARVRAWPGVVEKRTGIFYVGRDPFLHFHVMATGRRRADIKGRTGWTQLDVPRPITVKNRQALLRALDARYAERASPRGRRS